MKHYTTSSGLQIGCMYQTTVKPYHDKDAIKLQNALLNKHDPIDWDGITIVLVCGVVGAVALVDWWLGGIL